MEKIRYYINIKKIELVHKKKFKNIKIRINERNEESMQKHNIKSRIREERQAGITLVALVITVVVMLILAGVAIAAVVDGEGLFSKTRQAAETYENATREEGEKIQSLINEIDKYLEGNIEEEEIKVEPETVAKIGDFVNYSVQVDSNGNDVIDEGETYDKWRILDFDNNGHMEIVCYNGPEFEMSGKEDYLNAIKILNDVSIPYGKGTYGYSTRHLGSDPSNPSSYETIDESYIKFYEDYDNIESNTNYEYLCQTHHESDWDAILSFSNTAEGKKLAREIWLASRSVNAISRNSGFRVRVVGSSGTFYSNNLCFVYSGGGEFAYSGSNALAPVVSLESGVKINTSTAGNGSEESPWTLTK